MINRFFGSCKARLIKALGGQLPSEKKTPPRFERPYLGGELGFALKGLALKDPERAKKAVAEVQALQAPPRRLSIFERARLAVGTAIVAGLGHITPDLQRGASANTEVVLQEALGGSLLGDRGTLTQNEDIGFRPISERAYGKRTRDLTILSHREMINVGLWLYSTNALGEWIVDTPVALTVGEGIGFEPAINVGMAEDDPNAPPEAQKKESADALCSKIREALEKFWSHPQHNIRDRAAEYARTFLVTGHLDLIVTFVNPVDGCPQFDLVDAYQITGVSPWAGSAIRPGIVRFTPMDDGAINAVERGHLVISPDVTGPRAGLYNTHSDPSTGLYEVNDKGEHPACQKAAADAGMNIEDSVTIVGECLYFRRNKLLNSMRGTSYYLGIADWLDALDTFMWAMLDRAKLRNKLVWWLQAKGVSDPAKIQEIVSNFMRSMDANPAGAVYGSNESITLSAVNAQLGAADSIEIGGFITQNVLGSKGFPESWYAKGGGTNKSTAQEQTDVAYKTLIAMQSIFRNIFRTMLHFAYDCMQSRQPGVFPNRAKSPWLSIEPQLPRIAERDVSRLAAGCSQMAAALETAIEAELMSNQTGMAVWLDLLGQLTDKPYQADKEAQIVAQEQEEKDAAAMATAQARAKAVLGQHLDNIAAAGKSAQPPVGPPKLDPPDVSQGAAA